MASALFTTFSVTLLLTAIFALKFRYWLRPVVLAIYAGFFGVVEFIGHRYYIPEGLFGPWLGYLCLSLSVPVIIAIVLIHRHEKALERTEG